MKNVMAFLTMFCLVMFIVNFTHLAHAIAIMPDLNDGLVAHYKFNLYADDISCHGNHGSVNGALLTQDRFGNAQSAYLFDGIDDGIIIQNNCGLNVNNFQGGYTVGAWIKPEDTSSFYYNILAKGNNVFSIRLNRSKVEACHHQSSGTRCKTIGEVNTNKWSYVAVTWNISTGEWIGYLNGKQWNISSNVNDLVAGSEGDVTIGRDSRYDRWYFNGSIDDVRIYNRALSASEIQKLYKQKTTPAKLSNNLDIHIPQIEFINQNGNAMSLWANFEYVEQDQDGNFLWKLKNCGINN